MALETEVVDVPGRATS